MDRFRELVSKLNVGDLVIRTPSPQLPAPDPAEAQKKLIDELPITKAFIENLPRHVVIKTAAKNDQKAVEALRLLNSVDELIGSHVTAAADLRKYIEELSNVKVDLSAAQEQAYTLHQQLVQIDREIDRAEGVVSNVELDQLQQADDAAFEAHAQRRRADLSLKKQEYADKLASFQRDRFVVSRDFGQSRSTSQPRIENAPRLSPRPGSESPRPQSKGKDVQVQVQVDHDNVDRGGLDDFLGAEEAAKSQQSTGGRKRADGKAKGGKAASLRGPPLAMRAKAAPARPKIDIMADEDPDFD
ncbi:hypothetical protein DRE_02780 [Drechslerella stenobrocha 248]|uniref:Uncharacterized protein n=1 Tax=Drechslerella stenobrocha 248 TaxID=1043628 RepID=W7I6M9_9PEZI|nr:hypothetical protein DRE_02780 [Drechslerella stenobrocha 248]